ncbi:MAG: DNA cytosine methyltransferase [Gallionella sp.]|nr:DNA cytosine methyltransferase [Gallionella sp.]
MSWLFSQALVAEYSEGTCSDGEPSAQSNGNHIPQAYCVPDKMTAFSRLSRFGMTFAPLTEGRGEALLTSYLADFLAKTSAPQGGGKGIDGERSGLWREMARIIGEVRPRFVFVENSPLLVGRGAAVVIGDLAALGYDAHWACIAASDLGAPHQRDRFWLVADTNSLRESQPQGLEQNQRGRTFDGSEDAGSPIRHGRNAQRTIEPMGRSEPDAQPQRSDCEAINECNFCGYEFDIDLLGIHGCPNCEGEGLSAPYSERQQELHAATVADQARQHSRCAAAGRGSAGWPTEPDVGRVANGVAARVDRLKAIGNGQVPRVAATAFRMLTA